MLCSSCRDSGTAGAPPPSADPETPDRSHHSNSATARQAAGLSVNIGWVYVRASCACGITGLQAVSWHTKPASLRHRQIRSEAVATGTLVCSAQRTGCVQLLYQQAQLLQLRQGRLLPRAGSCCCCCCCELRRGISAWLLLLLLLLQQFTGAASALDLSSRSWCVMCRPRLLQELQLVDGAGCLVTLEGQQLQLQAAGAHSTLHCTRSTAQHSTAGGARAGVRSHVWSLHGTSAAVRHCHHPHTFSRPESLRM